MRLDGACGGSARTFRDSRQISPHLVEDRLGAFSYVAVTRDLTINL